MSSGLTSSTGNLVLSGALLYIDDDTNASGIISGEVFGFTGEFAELYSGKGIKTLTIKKARRQSISVKGNWHEITPKAINIFYGGEYSVGAGYERTEWKNTVVSASTHKFKMIWEDIDSNDHELTIYNGRNGNFGDIPVDGEDFSSLSFEINPEPVDPGDADEVLVRYDKLTA